MTKINFIVLVVVVVNILYGCLLYLCLSPKFKLENLNKRIQINYIKEGESIEEKANEVLIGSICFLSVNDTTVPSDTPFKDSPYGSIMIFNLGRPIIFAINHVGEFYIKMKTGSPEIYGSWVKI